MAEQHYHEYEAYLQKLSEGNVTKGIAYQPRAFWDVIQLDGLVPQQGHPEVFRNGEAFPIVLTHMTAAVTFLKQDGTTPEDERTIQRIGAYLNFHDQYYMNPPQQLGGGTTITATPLPCWSNNVVAAGDSVSQGTSSWRFKQPFILSVRDTLKISVGLYSTPASAVPVSVAFTGVGVISRQPYFLSGTVNLDSASLTDISTEQYMNDGAEPIMITDMVCQVQAPIAANDPTGDARRAFVRVKQVGNNSSSAWFQGPLNFQLPGTTVTLPGDVACMANLGPYSGRALVHEFPRPLIWEPGEGILVTAQGLTAAVGDASSVMIAMTGYIAIQ